MASKSSIKTKKATGKFLKQNGGNVSKYKFRKDGNNTGGSTINWNYIGQAQFGSEADDAAFVNSPNMRRADPNTVPLARIQNQDDQNLSNPGVYNNNPNARKNGPMKTQYSQGFQAFNTAATIGTVIGDTLQNIKTNKDEHGQYLKSIQPHPYENYQANGLNNIPVYTQYGGSQAEIVDKLVRSKLNLSHLQMGGKSVLSRFGPHPYEVEPQPHSPMYEDGGTYDRIDPNKLALYKLNLQSFQNGGQHYFPNAQKMPKNVWAVPGGWGKYNFGDDYVVQNGGWPADAQTPQGAERWRNYLAPRNNQYGGWPGADQAQPAGKWKNYLAPRNNQNGGPGGPQFRFIQGTTPTASDSAQYRENYNMAVQDQQYRKEHPYISGFQDFMGSSPYATYKRIERGERPGMPSPLHNNDPRVQQQMIEQGNWANAYGDALNGPKQNGGMAIRNGLIRQYTPSYQNYMANGGLTAKKAREILHDGTVHGKPISEAQRRYFGAVASGYAKKQTGGPANPNAGPDMTTPGVQVQGQVAGHTERGLSPEDYYKASAQLSYYKDKLNNQLKQKNPQAYTDYFSGLQKARQQGQKQGYDYIQNNNYNENLSPEEVKKTLGTDKDYQNYLNSLSTVNTYNKKQGQQPLYGTQEQAGDPSQLSYGRRFASLQVTPSFSNTAVNPGTNAKRDYSRQYQYNPNTGNVDFTETGDTSLRPEGFSAAPPPATNNSVSARQYGGYNVGDEVDLTEEEIERLKAQGYQFEDSDDDFSILH